MMRAVAVAAASRSPMLSRISPDKNAMDQPEDDLHDLSSRIEELCIHAARLRTLRLAAEGLRSGCRGSGAPYRRRQAGGASVALEGNLRAVVSVYLAAG